MLESEFSLAENEVALLHFRAVMHKSVLYMSLVLTCRPLVFSAVSSFHVLVAI